MTTIQPEKQDESGHNKTGRFKPGASGNIGEIHLDHIIPQRAFDLSNDEEWRACWSLTNLQPLWAKDNLRKSGRIEKLI
jgi:hypothetical protein